MKYRVKKLFSGRWVVQGKVIWFIPWQTISDLFEFKETAEEFKKYLENTE